MTNHLGGVSGECYEVQDVLAEGDSIALAMRHERDPEVALPKYTSRFLFQAVETTRWDIRGEMIHNGEEIEHA